MLSHAYLIALPHIGSEPGGIGWWLGRTPLNIVVDGSDAVLIFFLLSGIVVALPALRPGFRWAAYFPRRVVRLYVPVLASILLALMLIFAVPRDGLHEGQWASDASAASVTTSMLVRESLLLTTNPRINNPLWSLTWEVVFSLLLPIFVALSLWTRRFWLAAMVVCIAIRVVGNAANLEMLVYLPVFLIGTIAAANLGKIMAAVDAVRGSRFARWAWAGVATVSIAMLTAAPTLQGLGIEPGATISVAKQLPIIGAAGLIFLALGSPWVIRALEAPASRWAGRLSFSLYLVHVPILVTVLALLGATAWVPAVALGIVISFGVAWVFERYVEVPSHRLAKRIGSVPSS